MPQAFHLKERPAGITANFALKGGQVKVMTTELLGPLDSTLLVERLEGLQSMVFSEIPNFPSASQIDNFLILINQDLSGTAYINELEIRAQIKINRSVKKGEAVYLKDIKDITSVEVGVEIPDSAGIILMRSQGWKKSLFFDFGPLHLDATPRDYAVDKMFAKQALLLFGMESLVYGSEGNEFAEDQLELMSKGFKKLNKLIDLKSEDESQYQEVFQEHPWMFGGQYKSVDRHTSFDDKNIPDFTAVRCHDTFRDIIEIKQPFLNCFKKGDKFSSSFNDAWNQAERYLSFTYRQSSYLNEEKGLSFANPKCILLIGCSLTENQQKMIQEKENVASSIIVYTYDHIREIACHILNLIASTRDKMANQHMDFTGEMPTD